MRVTVEPDLCIAGGHCVLQAPLVFDQDDDTGTVVLLDAEPADDLRHAVTIAAQMCPAMAITLHD